MMKILVLSILFPLVLVGCATVPPYHAAGDNGGYGYAEQKIESNKYRVTFNGNSSTSRQSVENFLLYRAAELTLETGNDHFVLIENDTDSHTSYSVTSRFPRYGRRAYIIGPREYAYSYPYYSYGFDWGDRYDRDIQNIHEYTRYTAEAYISVFPGQKPTNDPNVFNAKDVIKNLAHFVERTNAK